MGKGQAPLMAHLQFMGIIFLPVLVFVLKALVAKDFMLLLMVQAYLQCMLQIHMVEPRTLATK